MQHTPTPTSPPARFRSGRRRFLKQSASGLFFLTAARYLPPAAIAAGPGSNLHGPLKYLSANEYRVLREASARFVGLPVAVAAGQGDIDAALRADAFLAGEDPEIQQQFHLLLTVFSSTLFAFLFSFRTRRFLDMSAAEQDAWIDDWMTSRLAFRRKGYIALKRLCMSMYYTDTRSWTELQYEGSIPEGGAR